jgi:prepilin peptidase CpaA
MNLAGPAPAWLLVVLALLLLAAAVEDALRLRISNVTCAGVLLTGIAAMALTGFHGALWQNALVFALLLGGGTFLFGAGVVGGGDVKLFAALGLWVSLQGGLWLIAAVFLSGGVLALLFIGARIVRGRGGRKHRGQIPYGLAIAAGAVIAFAAQRDAWQTQHRANPFSVAPFAHPRHT